MSCVFKRKLFCWLCAHTSGTFSPPERNNCVCNFCMKKKVFLKSMVIMCALRHTKLQAQAFDWCEKCILDSNSEVVCLPRSMRVLTSPCYPYGFLQVMVRSCRVEWGEKYLKRLKENQKITGLQTFRSLLPVNVSCASWLVQEVWARCQ